MARWRVLQSTEAKILLAALATIASVTLLSVLEIVFRPPPIFLVLLRALAEFVWLPLATVFALVLAFNTAWKRQWMAVLYCLLLPAYAAAFWSNGGDTQRFLLPTIQKLEFAARKNRFDEITANEHLIRVSYLDTSIWCCSTQTFEEIWFDRSNRLGSADPAVRDDVFWPSHPALLGHTQYLVRPLGGHYYVVLIAF